MDQVINVAYSPLLSSYHASCVTVDGHDVHNLFSMDRGIRSKGMRPERFIRPPLSLSVDFKFPLRLSHILIQLKIDCNEVCKISLETSKSSLYHNKSSSSAVSIRREEGDNDSLIVLIFSNPPLTHDGGGCDGDFFYPKAVIGSQLHAKYTSQKRRLMAAKNTHNQTRPIPLSNDICTSASPVTDTVILKFLYWSGHKPLFIQSIEMWGSLPDTGRRGRRPGIVDDIKIFEDFKCLLLEREQVGSGGSRGKTSPSDIKPLLYNSSNWSSTSCSSSSRNEEKKNDKDIINDSKDIPKSAESSFPLKYTDSITHNLMTLPVLLPSGHYVDQSTLDKTIELDTMCGRLPTDPFTGIPYASQPLFSSSLKAEIDEYVSSVEASVSGRTVGSAKDIVKHQSRLKRKVCVLPNNDGLKSEDLQCQEKMQPVKKRKTGSFGKEEIKGDTEAYRNEVDNEDDVKATTVQTVQARAGGPMAMSYIPETVPAGMTNFMAGFPPGAHIFPGQYFNLNPAAAAAAAAGRRPGDMSPAGGPAPHPFFIPSTGHHGGQGPAGHQAFPVDVAYQQYPHHFDQKPSVAQDQRDIANALLQLNASSGSSTPQASTPTSSSSSSSLSVPKLNGFPHGSAGSGNSAAGSEDDSQSSPVDLLQSLKHGFPPSHSETGSPPGTIAIGFDARPGCRQFDGRFIQDIKPVFQSLSLPNIHHMNDGHGSAEGTPIAPPDISSPMSDKIFSTPPPGKQRRTSNKGNNVCQICGKSYARPSTLKTHMRTHSGEKPYRCDICGKAFTQAANLTAHLRTHSGEKPFSCPICQKRFSQSSSVTTHLRTHSGERPYRCDYCGKCFADTSTLTKHKRIHSGEKPYRCKICNLGFSQSGNLHRHMKTHNNQLSAQLTAV